MNFQICSDTIHKSSNLKSTPSGPGPPYTSRLSGMDSQGAIYRPSKRFKVDIADPVGSNGTIMERFSPQSDFMKPSFSGIGSIRPTPTPPALVPVSTPKVEIPSPHVTMSSTPTEAQMINSNSMTKSTDQNEASASDGLSSIKNLNFSTVPEDQDDFAFTRKQKTPRDPMSHRIIEKRRRDRMNNCLADLSRLIPTHYIKQGQGRIEKTEIIEMATKHLKHLHNILPKEKIVDSNLEFSKSQIEEDKQKAERFLMGYKECGTELMRFLMDQEGLTTKDRLFVRVVNFLAEREKVVKQSMALVGAPSTKTEPSSPNLKSSRGGNDGTTESQSASGDLQASEPDGDSSSVSSRCLTKSSESSGYSSVSSFHLMNRALREELKMEETEMAEEKEKESNRAETDSGTGSAEATLRELLSKPDPNLPKFETKEKVEKVLSGKRDSNEDKPIIILDEAKSVGAKETDCRHPGGAVPCDANCDSKSPDSVYNFKKDIKQRFSSDPDAQAPPSTIPSIPSTTISPPATPIDSLSHSKSWSSCDPSTTTCQAYEGCCTVGSSNISFADGSSVPPDPSANPAVSAPRISAGCHASSSAALFNRMRGHNSKDSKEKIMEEHIRMKRKQEQKDQKEDGCFSSSMTPSPPESTSSAETVNPAAAPAAVAAAAGSPAPIGIPCFALHPSGTFYVPIALHPNLVHPAIESKLNPRSPCPPLCHPVSIPVNFLSPDSPSGGFAIHNINVSNAAGISPVPYDAVS